MELGSSARLEAKGKPIGHPPRGHGVRRVPSPPSQIPNGAMTPRGGAVWADDIMRPNFKSAPRADEEILKCDWCRLEMWGPVLKTFVEDLQGKVGQYHPDCWTYGKQLDTNTIGWEITRYAGEEL